MSAETNISSDRTAEDISTIMVETFAVGKFQEVDHEIIEKS